MTIPGFLVRNAFRNKRRLLLSVLGIAVSMFLLVTLMVVLRELTQPPNDGGSSLRITVRNKLSLANPLPARQLPVIEKIPGVEAVMPLTWFGGKFKEDEPLMWPQFAVDPRKFRKIFGEIRVPEDQYEAWVKDRTSCIVGRDTFKEQKMHIGQKLTFLSGIYPCSVELTIVGLYEGSIDDRVVWFHHAYLDEALDDWGKVGDWWIKATNTETAAQICPLIEAAFANTSDEVRAESERAFQLSFVSMWGGIKLLIGGVSTAVLVSLLLVTASTVSMSIRERFRELAILKAIGFQRRELCAFILAESFGLSALGVVLGAGGAWLMSRTMDIKSLTHGAFVSFEVTPQMLGTAALAAAALGILSSVFPAMSVARMSVVEGLRTLD